MTDHPSRTGDSRPRRDPLHEDSTGRPEEEGLSLDELGRAYAQLTGERALEPYSPSESGDQASAADGADDADDPDWQEEEEQLAGVSPRSILEAILFVGHPENEPLSSRVIAGLMRGVRPAEIDDLVEELNEEYDEVGHPFRIESVDRGYRLSLRVPEYQPLRDRFFGRVKQARLSQAAVDVLAIVAYHPGIPRDRVDQLRGKGSGSILSSLVRRGLLRLERPEKAPRTPRYYPTDKFLDVFGLEQLDDLPKSQDL